MNPVTPPAASTHAAGRRREVTGAPVALLVFEADGQEAGEVARDGLGGGAQERLLWASSELA